MGSARVTGPKEVKEKPQVRQHRELSAKRLLEITWKLKDFTTMLTLTATSTPNFYDVLSSNGYDHYPLLVEGPGKITCGCWGFTRHKHCYHVLETAQMVTYIPEQATTAVPVQGAEATEVTCSCCGAWMMKWAWTTHLRGNFCQVYLEAAPEAAPAPVAASISAAYRLPLAA